MVPILFLFVASASAVTISPIYGPDIWFSVQSHSTDVQTIQGSIAGLHSHSIAIDDTYRQRFVRMEGKYRIIHTDGAEIEHHAEDGETRILHRPIHDIIRFDLAGIFDSGVSDPIDLIPLYPNQMVSLGDTWTPTAAVKTNYGTGMASYKFHVENIAQSRGGHTIARISSVFQIKPPTLAGFCRRHDRSHRWRMVSLGLHNKPAKRNPSPRSLHVDNRQSSGSPVHYR